MCLTYEGASDVWDETTRTARKEHRCYECCGRIQPGEQYTHVGCLSDGSWSSFSFCACCRFLWTALHWFVCGGRGMKR